MTSPAPSTSRNRASEVRRASLPRSSSTTALLIAGVVGLMLLAATAALMHAMTTRFALAVHRTQEQEQCAETLASLSAALRDADRAQATYVLTGSDSAWKQFAVETSRISDEFEALRATSASNSALSAHLNEIEPDLGTLLSRMSRVMQLRKTYGAAFQPTADTNAIRESVDKFARSLWAAQQDVTAANRSRMALDVAATFRKELLAFAIALLAFTVSAFWILSLRRERLRAEQASHEIADRAELWRAILDSTPVAISIVNEHSRLLACNAAFERLSLFTAADFGGCNLNDCMVPKPLKLEAAEHMEHVMAGSNRTLMTRRLRKDGTALEVMLQSAPLILAGQPAGIISMYLEPAEHKLRQLESAAHAARDQRDAAISEKNQFTADLLYSFSRPLLELRSSTRSLRQCEDPVNASRSRRVIQAADGMSATVQQVADLHQAELGTLQLDRTEFDLRIVLEASLPVAIEPGVPERVVGDPKRLRQVIELLGQIRSQSGRVALCVELESRNNNNVCLHFSFAGQFGTDVEGTSVAKRLAVKLLALMGGRTWGDTQSRGGLQFHAMFGLPTQVNRPLADGQVSALTGSAVN